MQSCYFQILYRRQETLNFQKFCKSAQIQNAIPMKESSQETK